MSKYGFKELIVWQKAKALAVDIYACSLALPSFLRFTKA